MPTTFIYFNAFSKWRLCATICSCYRHKKFFCLVPRTINQLKATDLNVQQLSATVQISWNVAFNDNLAALFYGYQFQYNCDNDNTWTNGYSVLASNIRTTIITGLQRNVPCQVRIAPVGIQTYVVINDTPSAITAFILSEYNTCL